MRVRALAPRDDLTISSLSPARSRRRENSEGATASPLCSTTTLRGRKLCAAKNSSSEQGSLASSAFPLAVTVPLFTRGASPWGAFEIRAWDSEFFTK